jgi:5-methylcytosine-specific restriction endonuclease McrA
MANPLEQAFKFDPYATKNKKRIPVRKGLRKYILSKVQNGKCAKCHRNIREMKVRPILHHVNLNPKDNRPENLIVICPNCHDKIHQKEKKVVRIVRGPFGYSERRIVKIERNRKRRTTEKKTWY